MIEYGKIRRRDDHAGRDADSLSRRALQEFTRRTCGVPPESLATSGLRGVLPVLASRFAQQGRRVDLVVAPVPCLSAEGERLVYLTVAEALSNWAQHSGASVCRVRVGPLEQRIWVSVWDDGIGGAHLAARRALDTLAQSLRSRGDRLDLRSPYGGPTALTVSLAG